MSTTALTVEARTDRRKPERLLLRRFPLAPVVTPVTLGAAAILALACVSLWRAHPPAGTWAELGMLLAAALFVEAFPVPISGVTAGGVSLAAVFIVAAGSLYGWAAAALLAFVTRGVIELVQRRPVVRFAYNGAVYAASGAAAGLVSGVWAGRSGVSDLLLQVLLGAIAFYVVNVVLVAAVIARSSREAFVRVVGQTSRSTILPFAIMASVTVILDALWQRSPILSAALVGPLVATSLYQRSVHRALEATKLALTDPLTGLGNYRHFHERLAELLDGADERAEPLAICLFDVDDFKDVNDRYGHPFGDRALELVGAALRLSGEAFRLGGDEFALLLPRGSEGEAFAIASQVVARTTGVELEPGVFVSVSAGVATYPSSGVTRSDLVSVADRTLYAAKAEGKNAVRIYRPGVVEISARRALEQSDRRARLDAAGCLARAIDFRDAYTGSHSEAVGNLSARLARRLGLSAEEVELLRLAGRLHDLGKLAISEVVLCKPTEPTEPERRALETHPVIGYRMLSTLNIEPVATWVLHHHERWDGSGYPHGLAGEDIPIGSRILFVADAYEAMTTDRIYRERVPHDDAIAELLSCAGTQFDPDVVAALVAELGQGLVEMAVAAG